MANSLSATRTRVTSTDFVSREQLLITTNDFTYYRIIMSHNGSVISEIVIEMVNRRHVWNYVDKLS